MSIRRLLPGDAAAYRALMLEAYQFHPDAFTTTAGERAGLPLSWWEGRLSDAPGADTVMLGAFQDERLVGVVGLSFEPRQKACHKAKVLGLYIAAPFRHRNLASELGNALLAAARSRPGVKVLQATVTQGNRPAEAFFERLGFIPYGVEPFAVALDEGYLSKVHLWRSLSAELAPPDGRATCPAIARSAD